MKTKLLNVDRLNIDYEKISKASAYIKSGGLVAFPTETVYGLGANADNEEAVLSIFKAKGRPSDNPLIVHVSDMEMAKRYVREIPKRALLLADKFWGGPLTIIMKKKDTVLNAVSAGLDTVGIRIPSHPVAHELIKESNVGIAAPSANISGSPSPTVAEHVISDFDGKIDCIISSGASEYGLESTVIDLSTDESKILRPGAVSLEMIREIIPDAAYGGGGAGVPKSPGMKYKHYAPKAKVLVVEDPASEVKKYSDDTAVIDYEKNSPFYKGKLFLSCGKDDTDYGARLFYLLRMADSLGAKLILAKNPDGKYPITDALKNRLYKSAGGNVI